MLIDHVQLVGTAYSTYDAVLYIVLGCRCCFVSTHYTTGIGAYIRIYACMHACVHAQLIKL